MNFIVGGDDHFERGLETIWTGPEEHVQHAPLINFDNDVVLNRLGRQVDRRFCRGQRPRQPSHPHSEEMSKKKRDVPHEQEGGKGVLARGGNYSRVTESIHPVVGRLFHR